MVSEMLEQKSAAEIGEYGYSHWTGKQVTPGVHGLACVPQSIADGWDAYCSCGEWRAFESMWDCPTTGILLDKLRVAHEKHCASLGAEVSYPNTPSKDPTDAE